MEHSKCKSVPYIPCHGRHENSFWEGADLCVDLERGFPSVLVEILNPSDESSQIFLS